MKTPDIRTVSDLTPEIIATASYWFFVYADGGEVRRTDKLTFKNGKLIRHFWFWFNGHTAVYEPTTRCFPCSFDSAIGVPIPEPWPLAEDETQILSLGGYSTDLTPKLEPLRDESSLEEVWHLRDQMGISIARCWPCPNHHPSPRKGKSGPVWVWQKNKS